jgi:hypothetical protein
MAKFAEAESQALKSSSISSWLLDTFRELAGMLFQVPH